MSTRNGKIARLPRPIRDELNRRLEDSEESPELLDWLNALPEVQKVLQEQFAGVPISKQNLSQWRQGGFQEALARRDLAQDIQDFSELASEAGKNSSAGELADQAAVLLAARFGALLANWNGEPDDKFAAKVKILNSLSKTLVQLQQQIHRSRRDQSEIQTQREEKEKARKLEENRQMVNRCHDARKIPGYAQHFGGGTGGWKVADFVLAVQRGEVDARLNLEPTDTFEDPKAQITPVTLGQTQSK